DQPADACTLIEGTGPHLLLIGDSHAGMMIPTLRAIARTHNLTLSVAVEKGCPWQHDLYVRPLAGDSIRVDLCQQFKDDSYDRVLPALDPDVVIVMSRAYEALGERLQFVGPDRQEMDMSSPDLGSWLEARTVGSLDELAADRRAVVLLEPIPSPPDEFDTLACLSGAAVVEECRYVTDRDLSASEEVYRRLDAADERVWSTDLDGLICPFLPICDAIVEGEVVKTDGSHLTGAFARTLAPGLADYLTSNGILP
ncbi:MAG: SGNH hydrolase domain-containing protein, partial [Acidimicrobiales bacterium]